MPAVSVIIPNFNHEKYLKQRIESILNQNFSDFELIILDDCSTDHSNNIIDQYRNHQKVSKIIYNEVNSGSTFNQWEKGISISKGDIIWIAESDDICEPDFLETLIEKFTNSVGIVYSQSYKLSSENKVTGTWLTWTNQFINREIFEKDFQMDGLLFIKMFLIYSNTIPNASAVLFKKSIYLAAGGANEGLKVNNDWIIWLKMLSLTNIAYVAKPLNYFRYHSNSVVANALKKPEFPGKRDQLLRLILKKILTESSSLKDFYSVNKKLIADSYLDEVSYYWKKNKRATALILLFKELFKGSFTFLYINKHVRKLL